MKARCCTHRASYAPGCTQVAPNCNQCKTKALMQNESRRLYHFLSHSTQKNACFDTECAFFLYNPALHSRPIEKSPICNFGRRFPEMDVRFCFVVSSARSVFLGIFHQSVAKFHILCYTVHGTRCLYRLQRAMKSNGGAKGRTVCKSFADVCVRGSPMSQRNAEAELLKR